MAIFQYLSQDVQTIAAQRLDKVIHGQGLKIHPPLANAVIHTYTLCAILHTLSALNCRSHELNNKDDVLDFK